MWFTFKFVVIKKRNFIDGECMNNNFYILLYINNNNYRTQCFCVKLKCNKIEIIFR